MTGYIKLHRRIQDWEWYTDANVFRVFIHCLCRANHIDSKWKGILISKGSFVSSYGNIAKDLRLSVHQVRVAIDKLKMTNEVAYKGHSKYSIITIKNWGRYQTSGNQDGNQVATNKNEEEIKKEEIRNVFSDFRFIELVFSWFEYKQSKKQAYANNKSRTAFLKKLQKLSGDSFNTAEAIINESIANNWSGIFELKQGGLNPKGKTAEQIEAEIEEKERQKREQN